MIRRILCHIISFILLLSFIIPAGAFSESPGDEFNALILSEIDKDSGNSFIGPRALNAIDSFLKDRIASLSGWELNYYMATTDKNDIGHFLLVLPKTKLEMPGENDLIRIKIAVIIEYTYKSDTEIRTEKIVAAQAFYESQDDFIIVSPYGSVIDPADQEITNTITDDEDSEILDFS